MNLHAPSSMNVKTLKGADARTSTFPSEIVDAGSSTR